MIAVVLITTVQPSADDIDSDVALHLCPPNTLHALRNALKLIGQCSGIDWLSPVPYAVAKISLGERQRLVQIV